MQGKIIIPREIISSKGNISYGEGLQAWNTLRFKRDLIDNFPALKEKRSKFSYKIIYYKDIKQALEELKEMEVMPFFLFVYKENPDNY